jgi:hypothetical protein
VNAGSGVIFSGSFEHLRGRLNLIEPDGWTVEERMFVEMAITGEPSS